MRVVAPISFVFGLKPDELCNGYDITEITDLAIAANEYISSFFVPKLIAKPENIEIKPEYDEFKKMYASFKQGGE